MPKIRFPELTDLVGPFYIELEGFNWVVSRWPPRILQTVEDARGKRCELVDAYRPSPPMEPAPFPDVAYEVATDEEAKAALERYGEAGPDDCTDEELQRLQDIISGNVPGESID